MTDAAVVNAIVRGRRSLPDVGEMCRMLERLTGAVVGSQKRLAELLGCHPECVSLWRRGKRRPSLALLRRLVELEGQLKAGGIPGGVKAADETYTQDPCGPRQERPAPLVASAVSVRVEGDQALLHFGVKVPGENEPRSIAEVLVPRRMLEQALGKFGTPIG